ncbi:MAG TPA: SprT family zinc-dependent metalloprotease [Pseudobdellovibrionaceae bacterium]|nr:SprT family zinc-dependent metalloprotease [Pseudobdellovibrionaceae bacterium]
MRRRNLLSLQQIESELQAPLCLLRRRGLKRLTLMVNRRGQVQISIPWQHSDEFALQFALDNLEWLRKQLEKSKERRAQLEKNQPVLRLGGTVPFLGQEFRLRWISGRTRARAEFADGELRVYCTEVDAELWRKLICRQYEAQARWHIEERVAYWAERMRETYGRISFRAQRTRWGSCTRSGNLSFNWKLMFAPPEVIDYVVIHELAHRQHLDHSPRFWSRVAEFDPYHKEHQDYLKRHQHRVHFLESFSLAMDPIATDPVTVEVENGNLSL